MPTKSDRLGNTHGVAVVTTALCISGSTSWPRRARRPLAPTLPSLNKTDSVYPGATLTRRYSVKGPHTNYWAMSGIWVAPGKPWIGSIRTALLATRARHLLVVQTNRKASAHVNICAHH
jgi:hypothetical protein